MTYENQYQWLDAHLESFFDALEINPVYYKGHVQGIISCDGDKAYGYKEQWTEAGVPFSHGVAIYLLTKIPPFSEEVRDGAKTQGQWVAPSDWVEDNYERFKPYLNPI